MSKTIVIFFDLGGVLCEGQSLEGRAYLIFRCIYGMPLNVDDMIKISQNPPTEIEIKDVITACHRLYEQDLFSNLVCNQYDYNFLFGIATNSPKEVSLFTQTLSFVKQELVIISSLVGVSKPETKFFKKIIDISKKYNPDKIFLIDDKKDIIDAANLVKPITALQFDNTAGDSLYEFIKAHLDK